MTDATSDTAAGQDETAKGYIAGQLSDIRTEREALKARLDALQVRERTLWADARRAGVSFGRIADVSGVDRATVFYALNPRTTVESRKAKTDEG